MDPHRVVVVKLGTSLLAADPGVTTSLSRQAAVLHDKGWRVAVVTSGAVGEGVRALGLTSRPRDLPTLQAAAAAGQPALMDRWCRSLAGAGLRAGQILLTREDVDDRVRFLNLRNTVTALWNARAVPVVNENDTVSTDELRGTGRQGAPGRVGPAGGSSFGDNDRLAAVLTSALSAEVLVLLSTVPGLLDPDGQVVPTVGDPAGVDHLVRAGTSDGGTGGMASKLDAARLVTSAGESMVLADGREPDVLLRALGLADPPVGTRFLPTTPGRLRGRSRWIAQARPRGRLHLDAGAAHAVVDADASLLPAGVTGVDGDFRRGDVVDLVASDGRVIARAISNYAAADAARVAGRRSSEVAAFVGAEADTELAHRDQIVRVTPRPSSLPVTP